VIEEAVMGRGSLLASVVLVLAIAAGIFFWLSQEEPSDGVAIPPIRASQPPAGAPTVRSEQPRAGVTPGNVPVAFTYVADGREIQVLQRDFDGLKKRIMMYNDLDFAQQGEDYDVFEFVFLAHDVRDAGIQITEEEIRADYARLFDAEEYEDRLQSYLEFHQVSREDFDEVVHGQIASHKLKTILRETGVCCDKEIYDEIAGYETQFRLAYVGFPAAAHREEFKDLPPHEADEKAMERCKTEAQSIKKAIGELNDELCRDEISAIEQEETAKGEQEIRDNGVTDAADAEKIRERHRAAAKQRTHLHKLAMSGRAFDRVMEARGLQVLDTGWFSPPSPLRPNDPPGKLFFQRYTLPTRLQKEQSGGVYEDKEGLECYLAKKIDERMVAPSVPPSEILRGRRRWTNRHGFQRGEVALRYPALMKKYQYVSREPGVLVQKLDPAKAAPAPQEQEEDGEGLPPAIAPVPPRNGDSPPPASPAPRRIGDAERSGGEEVR
jgi:hypothetical protein